LDVSASARREPQAEGLGGNGTLVKFGNQWVSAKGGVTNAQAKGLGPDILGRGRGGDVDNVGDNVGAGAGIGG
jgi:hypothetical protein